MHIFNLNNKPYLIISAQELLFRHNTLDEDMQRVLFSDIKSVSIEHRYNPQKELFIWLNIQTKTTHAPLLVQISLLDESLEEVFSILKNELNSKVKLKFPKNTKLSKLGNFNKGNKRLMLLSALVFFGLLMYHKLVPPSLTSVQEGLTKYVYQDPQGFCSSNVKVAYPTENSEYTLVKSYCGLFSFWKLQETKNVPLKYLETEFSPKTAKDWTLASREFVKEKDYTKAVESIEKALYLKPDDKYSEVLLSKIYTLQGEHKASLSLAKQTVQKYQDFGLAHENIAHLYKEDGNISAAYKHFKTYNQLDPKASSYIALAQIQDKQDLKEASFENYNKALVLDPDNTYLLSIIGLRYWDKQEFIKAKDALQKAYLLEPSTPAFFLNYFEVSLVTPSQVTPEQKEHFLQAYKEDTNRMMVYEMLQIIEATIEGKEVIQAKESWKEKYTNQKLDWSFTQIRAWLDDSRLEIEHKQDIQRTLGFFIGHQQAYAMIPHKSQD